MNNTFLLKLDNISFNRGNKQILSGINCTVWHQKHLAIIGPNGSGKTTLIKIMAGLEWPSSGKISFYGDEQTEPDIRDIRRHIGLVSYAGKKLINGWQKAKDIVTAGLDNSYDIYHDYAKQDWQLALQAMDQVNCLDCADKEFDILSEGQQQRVMIARAMVCQPSILILDEPCNGLDPAARDRLARDIEKLTLSENGPTIIYITHYMNEIYPFINTILALKSGRVFTCNTRDKVLQPDSLHELFYQ